VLNAIAPIVPLGLGWLGFRIGFSYDHSILDSSPPASGVLLAIIFPLLFTAAGCALVIFALNPENLANPDLWRDVSLCAVAAAMTSAISLRTHASRRPDVLSADALSRFAEVEQAIGILGLMFIAVYFRPTGDAVAWKLPPVAWLFVTLGVGLAMGVLAYGLLRATPKGPPFVVILIGVICMSAGMASFLRLSVVAVCFLVGLIVANFPGDWKPQVEVVLERMARPIVFILLVVAGALWSPFDWRGWALMGIFVVARLAGKTVGLWAAGRAGVSTLQKTERQAIALAPVGVFAIAIIISARDLYPGALVQIMLTAVIGAAFFSEIILLAVFPRLPQRT